MKKLLVAVLAFALFAPAFAVENVQITGDIQTIGLNLEGQGVIENQRGTTNRVMFGLGVDLVEDVHAKLTFAHRNIFGQEALSGETMSATAGTNRSFLQRTYLAEAYVTIANVFDALEVKVGRQFYGDEKSAVMYFGPDYDYAVGNKYYSLDGVTVKYNGENLIVTASYFKPLDRVTANDLANNATDTNLGGLDLNLKLSETLSASAYVYDVRTVGANNFGFWGVKPTFENDNVKLGVEFARNYGAHEKGWQVKADLALPIASDDFTFTPRVTYLKSEKGFEAYGNYRPGLMFGSVLGVVNRATIIAANPTPTIGNWEIINAGLCMKFANLEKWGFGLDFYTGELNSVFNGNSWEAKVVYNHNEYVAFNLTGAVLTNVKHFTASPTALQLGMNVKF